MKSQHLKNRWLIAASAVGIHISIGSVYAYSVMTNPVKDIFGTDESNIKWAFKIAILLLGLSAAFLGKWVEKVGPKISGLTAGAFYGVGIVGSGLAVQLESLPLFIICYGFIGGIGLGIGYITPVSTLVKWFPDRRGLATGMAIMGFGFAALIFGPLMAKLFETVGIANTFYTLGLVYMVLIFSSSLLALAVNSLTFSAKIEGSSFIESINDLYHLYRSAVELNSCFFSFLTENDLAINKICGYKKLGPGL